MEVGFGLYVLFLSPATRKERKETPLMGKDGLQILPLLYLNQNKFSFGSAGDKPPPYGCAVTTKFQKDNSFANVILT